MFPAISFLFYILGGSLNKIVNSKALLYIYILMLALLLAIIKNQIYEDDFYGYYSQYVELIKSGSVTLYSDGKEATLSLIMILVSIFGIENQVYFSFCIKLINYILLLKFVLQFIKFNQNKNKFIFILITLSPNFILYSDSFIRQSLSLIFIMFAVIQTKKINSFFYFFLSCTTHLSNIVYFPLIIFKYNIKITLIILIVSFFIEGLDFQLFSLIANLLGMGDKLLFIENIYTQGVVDTKPSISTFIPTILVISMILISNKTLTEQQKNIIVLFCYTMIIGNIVGNIPYATSRIAMLIMIYSPILLMLLRNKIQIIIGMLINCYLWVRFVGRDNPTMELNFQLLIWPINYYLE